MITQVSYLLPERQEWLCSRLEGHREHLREDVSRYAKGRQRFWLQHEALLTRDGGFRAGVRDEELWHQLLLLYPEAELGLAAYGAVGITAHRDHTYAHSHTVGINLGEVEAWGYSNQRTTLELQPQLAEPQPMLLTHPKPGAVWHFNSKNLHSAINPAPDRWAIFLWKISDRSRASFDHYLTMGD